MAATTMAKLMTRLGYDNDTENTSSTTTTTSQQGYFVQGGDWGSFIAQSMGLINPGPIKGLHLNFFPAFSSPGSLIIDQLRILFVDDSDSKRRNARMRDIRAVLDHTGYFHQQATKPEALAVGLSDSPAGLGAWLVEKFQVWSDSRLELDTKFRKRDLVANAMMYW
jgi:microsomal epoxide hydrolase